MFERVNDRISFLGKWFQALKSYKFSASLVQTFYIEQFPHLNELSALYSSYILLMTCSAKV